MDIEFYRRALGAVIRLAERHKLASLACVLPEEQLFGVTLSYLAKQTALILQMADYHFDAYITSSERSREHTVKVTLVLEYNKNTTNAALQEIREGLKEGVIIAEAVNKARTWCDTPPSDLTPLILADKAQELADTYGLKCTIFDEPTIIAMGMGGLAGVARGSEQDCRFVILEYTAKQADAPRIALVGKGITFDSGGLSLKPAQAMETMKDDMAGAAVVIATMQAIAQLKPAVHVVALAPLAENMPSGTGTKPGDILRFYNGKTAEVKNTDAEGRLILADALSYAIRQYHPTAIIDMATLTGAAANALGHFYGVLLSKHDALVDRIYDASRLSGDRVWRFPFDDDYKAAIKSDIADICNIGNPRYMAGTITAGFFLKNFVDDVPWAHFDIAGVAFNVPDISYFRPGASGFGVRLLVELLMHW